MAQMPHNKRPLVDLSGLVDVFFYYAPRISSLHSAAETTLRRLFTGGDRTATSSLRITAPMLAFATSKLITWLGFIPNSLASARNFALFSGYKAMELTELFVAICASIKNICAPTITPSGAQTSWLCVALGNGTRPKR